MENESSLVYLQLSLTQNNPNNIFERIQNGVLITDCRSKVIYTNPAFTRLTGYSATEILGKNPGILHSGRHGKEFYEKMWADIEKNGFWEGEIWNRKKTGEIFPEYLTISTLTG